MHQQQQQQQHLSGYATAPNTHHIRELMRVRRMRLVDALTDSHAKTGVPARLPDSWADVSDARLYAMGHYTEVELAEMNGDNATTGGPAPLFYSSGDSSGGVTTNVVMGRNLSMTEEFANSKQGQRLLREWNEVQMRHLNSPTRRRLRAERRRRRQLILDNNKQNMAAVAAEQRRLNSNQQKRHAVAIRTMRGGADAERPWNV